jgi:hypothetical protein
LSLLLALGSSPPAGLAPLKLAVLLLPLVKLPPGLALKLPAGIATARSLGVQQSPLKGD